MPIARIAALRKRHAVHRSVMLSHERFDLLLRSIEQQHDILLAHENGDKAKIVEAYEALDKDVVDFIELAP